MQESHGDNGVSQNNQVDYGRLRIIARNLNIPNIEHHIFLCCDQTEPNCCKKEVGLESWKYLKRRLRELALTPGRVYRTKVNCFQICEGGPIAVVYSRGKATWYHSCTSDVLERIIQEHILQGKPVSEFIFANHFEDQ